jgi:hypothetical protein
MLISIGIVTLILVVDWTFLVLASRRTLQLTDTLALAATSELIDEDRLADSAIPYPTSQGNDSLDANILIQQPGTGFLAMNNAALASQFRPLPSEVTITPARVIDASAPATGTNFTLTPGVGERFNTLRVEVNRDPSGSNPLYLLMRGFGAPETAKITSSSLATLDSRVVGYRPRANASSPVAPIAINRTAWEVSRLTSPPNVNGRRELVVLLRYDDGTDPLAQVNAALVNVNATVNGLPIASILQDQIIDGLIPADVDPVTDVLGPFTAAAPDDLYAENISPAIGNLNAIVAAFQNVQLSNDPRRVFLLYDTAAFPRLNITGFVAANILDAQAEQFGVSGHYRLRLELEPEAIVHFTAETMYTDAMSTIVPENDYCHKIRLTR